MPLKQDHALLEFGAAAAGAGEAPEIRVSAADAPRGGLRIEEAPAEKKAERETHSLETAAKVGRALIAYALAGLVGWHLYDLAAPVHLAWPDILSSGSAQKSAEQAEWLRVTQKLAADMRAIEARLTALEKARGHDANALSSDEANRRIEAAKAGLGAEIAALSNELKAVQQEALSKRAETQAGSDQPERRAGEAGGHAHQAAASAVHDRSAWKRRGRGDAFDPSLHPGAPGAPRPLGAALYR